MLPRGGLYSGRGGTRIHPADCARPSTEGGNRMSMSDQAQQDAAHLEKFGYKQELKRELGTFSSFAIAGILTVASVCATLPLALLPFLNQVFGWHLNTDLGSAEQKICALITLLLITLLNIYGVKLVAVVNNTGVFFEILGMVVLAI